jgi:hypothetical protein
VKTKAAPAASPIVPIDFKLKRRPTLKNLGKGVFAYPRDCPKCSARIDVAQKKCPSCGAPAPDLVFWERPFVNLRQTTRRLNSTTIRSAQIELGDKRAAQAKAKLGLATDPYRRSASWSVAELSEHYLDAGCPKKNRVHRDGRLLLEERSRVQTLQKFWGRKHVEQISLEDCREYHDWRVGSIKRGCGGHRQVDKELVTLSNVFRWAMRNRATGIRFNPIAHERERFCQPSNIRHCRDHQPDSGDELHALARYLFSSRRSEVLAWQLLFESLTGHRSHEIVGLRKDSSAPHQPGFVLAPGRAETVQQWLEFGRHVVIPRQVEIGNCAVLFLFDSTTSKGTYPYVQIHRALAGCLRAHSFWHATRFPRSPWFFPSPGSPARAIGNSALTHALSRICPAMALPHRTSHGLRSYFVNVLRSHAVPDAEIALMIGQKTAGRLIVDVYGKIPTAKLNFVPATESPAWNIWLPQRGAAEQLDLGL